MFEPGEKAVIDPKWYSKLRSRLYDIRSLSAEVEVTELGVEPESVSKIDVKVPEGTRWVRVLSGEIHVEIPEHHLRRPVAVGEQEDQYDKERRERLAAPITRFTSKTRLFGDDLPIQLSTKLGEALCAMTLEHRGHFGRGKEWDAPGWYTPEPRRREEMLTHNLRFNMRGPTVSEADAEAIVAAHEAGVALEAFVLVTRADRYYCPNCIQSEYEQPSFYETNGLVVRPVADCPNPDGLDTSWEMDFPSGKILVGNDFRDITQVASGRNINYRINTHLAILDYARSGLALGFGIGNTCPGLYRMEDGSYEIGSKQQRVWQVPKVEGVDPPEGVLPDEDKKAWWTTIQPADRTGDYDYCGDECIDMPGVDRVCGICTDLRAYSMIDLEEARKRFDYYYPEGDFEKYISKEDVVEVEPGKYRFQHFLGADLDAPNVTMARFERIGEAGVPFDFVKADTEFDVHLTQAVQIKLAGRRNTRKYFGDATPEWARAVAGAMSSATRGCVPDRDWHRNGFPQNFRFEEIEGIGIREIPRFRFQFLMDPRQWNDHIGQICKQEPDKTFGGVQTLNKSYAIGVGHLLESLISFGCKTRHCTDTEMFDPKDTSYKTKIPNPNYDKYDVKACRKSMRDAIDWWKYLLKFYPHVEEAMPDFANWMRDEKAVKLWVKHFDLGPEDFDRAAQDAKQAEETKLSEARQVLLYIVNNPGAEVEIVGGYLDGKRGVIAEPEGSPDHAIVLLEDVKDLEQVELPLTRLRLTPAGESKRQEDRAQIREETEALFAKMSKMSSN
jgi:hypothetical protein